MRNYNIDEMTLPEMIVLYSKIPRDEIQEHWLLKLHIECLLAKI